MGQCCIQHFKLIKSSKSIKDAWDLFSSSHRRVCCCDSSAILRLKSIKDAWDLPADDSKDENKDGSELGEYTEAEELVKASKRLTNPFEIMWKSFCLVFFTEWGDRSMLATIALGAAQSPWGVASGAIVGHLVATSVAVLGGAFLAKYISEKLVGYLGGVLFLLFAVATFFGFF
uniref:GDT1 family protein n=1 Tax=Chenopodium quinoa TaxID=63459 RepID=A0A803MU93_CHEQI